MSREFDIFSEVRPEILFAYLDALANPESGNPPRDPFGARMEFLKSELSKSAAEIERLRAEQAKNARLAETAARIEREIRETSLASRLEETPLYSLIRELVSRQTWLATRFELSAAFPIFARLSLDDLPRALSRAGNLKDEVWYCYLAALGIDDMGEILNAIQICQRDYARLPPDLKKCFVYPGHLSRYFNATIACLDYCWNLDYKTLEAMLRSRRENLAAGDSSWIIVVSRPETPGKDKGDVFHDLIGACLASAQILARALIEANENLKTTLTVALAVFPDPDFPALAEIYRPGGKGEPRRGALFNLIQSSSV